MIPALANVALRSRTSWRQGLYRVGLFGIAFWFVVRALSALWRFTIDDSGISYAYAKHIATGIGPVAAPGAPWVEGYSNALWVFLLVPFQWLSLPLDDVSKWLGTACFALTFALGVWLLVKDYGLRVGTSALAAGWIILLGTCADFVVWVVAGLENALLAALLLGLATAERRERERRECFPWSSVIAFALCITRPEGILYAAPILALALWDALRSRTSWRSVRRRALWFVLPLIAYHIGHFAVFHEWVANTYYAKPQGQSLGRAFEYLRKGLRDTGLLYLLPLALVGTLGAVRNKLALIWYCLAGVAFILYSGGDWMPYARFVSFFAPALVLLAIHGAANLGRLLSRIAERLNPRFAQLFGKASVALGLSLIVFQWNAYHAPRFAKESKSKFCHFCQRTSDAQRLQKLSKEAELGRVTVLTHDFGGPAWVSDETYYPIDFLGLCDASVARIRREQERLWANTLLSPYLFHEQPHAPTWIYLPRNFWQTLKELPEYRSGYYTLPSRLLPHAPAGSYLALHRGQLVDYFAPVDPSVAPAPLSTSLGLVGVSWFGAGAGDTRIDSGARLRVVVSLVPRARLRGGERVWVQLSGGGKPVVSEKVALGRGLSGLASQFVVGEPLRVELRLTIPQLKVGDAPPSLQLSVGVSPRRGEKDVVVEAAALSVGSELPAYQRVASRFPSGLPVAGPELAVYQRRVATAVERQHLSATWQQTTEDIDLAAELRALGDSLVASAPRQAYLAYVWSTQLDARQWERLTKPLLELREPIDDANTGNELALLRDYYAAISAALSEPKEGHRAPRPASPDEASPDEASPDEASPDESPQVSALGDADVIAAAERLRTFYARTQDAVKADYFERRATSARGGSAAPPWSWSQTFESEQPLEWTGDRDVFSVERPDPTQRKRWRGLAGNAYLNSRAKGDKGKGALTSPTFLLDGRRLSFLFGGSTGKSDVGVELLVDGSVVLSNTANTRLVLQSVWWDVTPWFGKTAQLRVFDRSSRQAAALDEVLLWK